MGISGSAESFPRLRGLEALGSFVEDFVFRLLRAGGLDVVAPSSSESDSSGSGEATTSSWSSVAASSAMAALTAGFESLEDLLIILVVAEWWWLMVDVKWLFKCRSESGTTRLSHAASSHAASRYRATRGLQVASSPASTDTIIFTTHLAPMTEKAVQRLFVFYDCTLTVTTNQEYSNEKPNRRNLI